MSEQNHQAIVEEILGEISQNEFLLINPDRAVIEAFVKTTKETEPANNIQILADEEELNAAVDDFLIGSRLADLISRERCSIRLLKNNVNNQLILTKDQIWTVITVDDNAESLSTTDQDFTDAVFRYYSEEWEDAEAFSFRTPPLTRVRETVREEFGDTFESDLMEVLTVASANDDPGLDAIEASLLVAARHEELLYDISKWGEDTGVASKATFSRTKTRLEEAGLITTEKVPLDVGRPRLRLMLPENLTDAAINELTWTAEDKLHSLTA